MRTFVLAAVFVLGAVPLCHCTQEEDMDLDLSVPSPVAVGATVTASLNGQSSRSLMDQPSVDDGSVFSIVDGAGNAQRSSFQLRALREGKTTFRARGDNGTKVGSIKEEIESASPNRLEMSSVEGCSSPFLVGTGAAFTVNARRFRGTTLLHGTGGVFPVESDIASNGEGSNVFTARATPGSGWIRSRVNDSRLRVEVFELSRVTELKVAGSNPVAPDVEVRLASNVLVDGTQACADVFPRDVSVSDASICEARLPETGTTVLVKGKKAGTCEVTVKLANTSLTATTTFRITGGEPEATDAGAGDAASDASPDASPDGGVGDGG